MRIPSPLVAPCALLLSAPAALAGAESGRLYERTLMLEANRRCALFTPPVAAALSVGAAQARTAALRAGDTASALNAVQSRAAAKARATPCGSPDLTTAAARVRDAYAGWSKLPRMDFPGAKAGWRADRTRSAEPKWRLVQTSRAGKDPVAFGLAAEGAEAPRLTAVTRSRGPAPVLVRLVLGGGHPVFLAESHAPAPKPLRPEGRGDALAFGFSPAAAGALQQLDPRRTVRLEFVVRAGSGETVRSAEVEVGDFAAARAFLLADAR